MTLFLALNSHLLEACHDLEIMVLHDMLSTDVATGASLSPWPSQKQDAVSAYIERCLASQRSWASTVSEARRWLSLPMH